MSRPAGARNHDFCEKRTALLDTLTDFALAAALTRPSLRQFAIAANQSEPTLRHYFGDRQGLVLEIIENIGLRSKAVWDLVRAPAANPAEATSEYFSLAEAGMKNGGFTRAHAFGVIEGFADDQAGKAYREKMLDPALRAFSDKLAVTQGGPRDPQELLAATLAATAPLFLFGVHQELLGGRQDEPIDMPKTFGLLQKWMTKAFTAA